MRATTRMTDHVQAYLSLRRAFGFHLPVSYLSQEEVTAVLDAPDRSSWSGHRDAVMLATMYNTGARVSEIIRLNVEDLQLRPTATVRIHGKECHSYCISFRRRNETTIIHVYRQACDLAFFSVDVLLVVRTGIGRGPYTDVH
jgi:site-specific recombinase XerD